VHNLILESASPGIEAETERRERVRADEALARMLEEDGIEAFVDYWEHIPLFRTQRALPPSIRETSRLQRWKNNPVGLANSLRGLGAGVAEPQWHRLSSLTVPSMIIVGELDEKYRSLGERMTSLLPRSHLTVIPEAGHAVHLEQPGLFLHAVMTFLQRDCLVANRYYNSRPGSAVAGNTVTTKEN
jgi:2-succinyl-6-hydroxy-2,4-cyclohexadiene-1-carboxylate synthase